MATDHKDILIINSAHDDDHANKLLELLKENNVTEKIDMINMLVEYDNILQNLCAAISKTRLLLVLMSEGLSRDEAMKTAILSALHTTFSKRRANMRLVYLLPERCQVATDLPYYHELQGYITMTMEIHWKLDDPSRFIQTVAKLLETIKNKPPTESIDTGTSQPASRDETDHRKQTGTTMQCDVGWAKTIIKEGKAYKMSSSPRGRAVIINNYTFDNPKNNREGAKYDTINLHKLLRDLGFTVIRHENKTSEEIREIIKDEQESPDHGDCFILFLLSHGQSGSIYGKDKTTVNLQEEVIEKFYAKACPALKDKPVIIFIQACRNKPGQSPSEEELCEKMEKMKIDELGEISYDGGIFSVDLKASDAKDVVQINATVDGCKAYRDVNKGSLLVTAIIDVFRAHCHEKELLDLIREIPAGCHGLLFPECTFRMKKKFYFFPGYFE